MILYGKPVADALLKSAKKAVASLESTPKLVIITNPNDNASAVYVKNKVNACAACGIDAIATPMPDMTITARWAYPFTATPWTPCTRLTCASTVLCGSLGWVKSALSYPQRRCVLLWIRQAVQHGAILTRTTKPTKR